MGQPNVDVPRDVAGGARFSIQTGGRGKAPRRHPRSMTRHARWPSGWRPFWLAGFEKWGEIRASRYGLFGSAELAPYLDTLTQKCESIRELRGQINAILTQKTTCWSRSDGQLRQKMVALLTLIESYVQQDSPFLCIPTVNEPHTSTVSQVWENTNNQTEVKKEDCLEILHALKKDLLVNPWSRHTIEVARSEVCEMATGCN